METPNMQLHLHHHDDDAPALLDIARFLWPDIPDDWITIHETETDPSDKHQHITIHVEYPDLADVIPLGIAYIRHAARAAGIDPDNYYNQTYLPRAWFEIVTDEGTSAEKMHAPAVIVANAPPPPLLDIEHAPSRDEMLRAWTREAPRPVLRLTAPGDPITRQRGLFDPS